jgi:pimeloyl-ACP methyl ester carboxylesterase
MQPRTRYVRGPEGHVAYQVLGQGPRDIVFVPDHPNNIEIMWEEPAISRFLERLAATGRVICFDKRGTGISDPVPLGALPTVEQWMDDVTTVIDAVGCDRVVMFGHGDGGPIAMLFAATYPERTEALVLGDTFARMRHAPDYPDGLSEADAERKLTQLCKSWGTEDRAVPSDPARHGRSSSPRIRLRSRFERLSLNPGRSSGCTPSATSMKRPLGPGSIRVPTLVFHRRDNRWIPFVRALPR